MGDENCKKEYSSSNAAPVVVYSKKTMSDRDAWPLRQTEGGLLLAGNGLSLPEWDYCAMVINPSTTETYSFRKGGSNGTLVATVVAVYTDATRADISTVSRTP